jgi:murein DD-endopeptidase MepM/ murein hydrolase activator NlpD
MTFPYDKIPKMKRFFAFFFLLFLIFSLVWAETALEEQARLKAIQEQLEAQKKKLVETKKKESEALSKLVVIKQELKVTTRDLTRAKQRIVINEGQLVELSSEIKDTQLTLSEKSARFKKRIREVYKNSTVNYLELLLSARSMSDFINRAYYFGKLVETDVGLIQEIAEAYQKTKKQKQKLEYTTGEIKSLAKEIDEKRQEISEKAEEEKKVYQDLKARRAEHERKVAELEKSSEELERVIQARLAARKRAGLYAAGTGAMDWPLRGRITSNYGYRRDPFWRGRHRHTGVDVAAPYGEVIRAADSGTVLYSGWWDGYGKAVVIDHGKNISTVYGHMSRIYAQNDNTVKKGQIIGLVGSTGYSTGPHLHFEVRVNGKPTNPMPYLP